MRLHLAESLGADLLEDEDALDYLVHYGMDRVGVRDQEALGSWVLDMHRQTRRFMKNRTLGSAAKDMMAFLVAMDGIGGRGPGG